VSRRSTIVRLAAPVKAAIDAALKHDRLTLDELLDYLRTQYPDETLPSRSALGRYKQSFDELAANLRETREIADIWAAKLGDAPESDVGKVVLEILRTLSYRVGADLMQPGTDVDAKTVGQLAKAMQYIEDAGRLGLAREQAVQKAALEKAASNVEMLMKAGGKVTPQQILERIRGAYGLEA
jgi:Protein of unknown function (DUF3486).